MNLRFIDYWFTIETAFFLCKIYKQIFSFSNIVPCIPKEKARNWSFHPKPLSNPSSKWYNKPITYRNEGKTLIEIVFSESACESLKIAQRCGQTSSGCFMVSAPIGVIVHREIDDEQQPDPQEIQTMMEQAEYEEKQRMEKAVPMGGNPADVYCLDMALSVGDISGDLFGESRAAQLQQLLMTFRGTENWFSERLQNAAKNLDTILQRALMGEELRIWYSDEPDELCGMYWLLSELNGLNHHGKVWLVKMPDWQPEQDGKFVVIHTSWGEICPEQWYPYTALQREAPSALIVGCAMQWQDLKKENAPLRASVNGHLTCVPEDFYDSFIYREIARKPQQFREAEVVGRVVGHYQFGLSDGWIAGRIEKMIQSGLLEPVDQPPDDHPTYRRTLRKTPLLMENTR